MTDRYKKAVKSYVKDYNLTAHEKDELLKIAKEDGINETDAIVYMNSELKKIISRKQTRDELIEGAKEVGEVIVKVGGFVLAVIAVFRPPSKGSNNNKS